MLIDPLPGTRWVDFKIFKTQFFYELAYAWKAQPNYLEENGEASPFI